MKKYGKKGISLILLVITIIVVIILATAIILSITNSGVLDSAKKSKFMSDYKSVEEGINMYSLSNINMSDSNTVKLPLEGKLDLSDKQDIINSMPTLKIKIEELNPGKTIDDIDLYYINESEAGVNTLAPNKKEKGYIIDAATRQIYDYVGDNFEGKRWHTLDGGVVDTGIVTGPEETQEIWNGWMKLTLYYPASSTDKKWRMGSEGEIRVDPMLMWQNYTGPITIPLDRTKDVWIKYKLDNKEVVIPPAGTLLVDIVPDSSGTNKVKQINVNINYDEFATVKEYKVGESAWTSYTNPFIVTENCIIQARAKKIENIYNTDGSLLLTRDIVGSDMVYIGNIAIEEITLIAPTIIRLPAIGSEKARVKVTYPETATKKIYTINYGVEGNYTSEINVQEFGTYIIAYYYDVNSKKSVSSSIYVNDISKGDLPEQPKSHEPLPPYEPNNPPPFEPKQPNNINLLAPTITRIIGQNDEKARVQISYPTQAVRKIYIQNYGLEKVYSQDIVVNTWGTFIMAYYYDADGNKSKISYIRITEGITPPDIFDPPVLTESTPVAPTININPNETIVTEVQVSISLPIEADKTYIKIGRYGNYQEYVSSIVVKDNDEIYAYYKTSEGKQSQEARARIKNIKKPGDTGIPNNTKPYVYIDAVVYPWSGSYGQSEVNITLLYSDADKIEYSEDGIIYKPYNTAFKITENKRIYAKGTNINGVTQTYLDITNIGKLTPPKTVKNLGININVNPEPLLSTVRVVKATVSIEYDVKAIEKYYKIGVNGDLKEYTGSFEVDKSTTVYAYAKSQDALGQTSKNIDNIIDGISDPLIIATPPKLIQSSKVRVKIEYDKYSTVKKYSIDGGILIDYTGEIEITKNRTTVYAYSENVKGQNSNATYTIENIVPTPPLLVLDKGNYYLLKLNYPDGSKGREYKWTASGQWKSYREAGILLIKPQFKDQVIQNGTLIKIEDENGKLVTFTGDYYLINVPISEMFENISMRWDRVAPGAPQIILNTNEPSMQVTATILFDQSFIEKKYRVLNPSEELGDWQDYTGPITINKNNAIIYSKGMDESEVWSAEGMYKVTNIDEIPPTINLTSELITSQQKMAVKVNITDNIEVGTIKWADGIKGESYFKTAGTQIENDSTVNITANGYYTFYAEDKAGNMQVSTLTVENVDFTPPLVNITLNPEITVGLGVEVLIDYGDSVIKQYKIGTNSTSWINYQDRFMVTSYLVLSNEYKNLDGTVTIYAKGKDALGNEVIVQKNITNLDLNPIYTPMYSNVNRNSEALNLSAYPNTQLYGTAIFDNNISTSWAHDYSTTTKRWIKWNMPVGRAISKLSILSGINSIGYTGMTQFRLYGSNTGVFGGEETLIYSGVNIIDDNYHDHKFFNQNKYTWYKLEGDWLPGEANRCREVKLYEAALTNELPIASIITTPSENLHTLFDISLNNDNSKDPSGRDVIDKEWKIDGVLKGNISTYKFLNIGTHIIELRVKNEYGIWSQWVQKVVDVSQGIPDFSNTNLASEATNITAYPTIQLYGTALFDGSTTTSWLHDYSTVLKRWIKWKMPTPRAISKLSVFSGINSSGYTGMSTFRLYGSNTGNFSGEEILLYSGVNIIDNNYHDHTFFNLTKYTWYKLEGDWLTGQANRCMEVKIFEPITP